VQRYIRLTELLPEVQKKVDSKEIAFSPAVELSYLTRDEQKQFLDAMDYSQNTPSLSQAQRLKKLSREGKCTKEVMRSIMSEEKKEEQERITLSSDTLRKYFPRSYTPLQMQQTIIKLLEQWQKKQQRRNER
jgi:ParB family chromosome partitioning protein